MLAGSLSPEQVEALPAPARAAYDDDGLVVAVIDEALSWAMRSGPGLVLIGPLGDLFAESVLATWSSIFPERDTTA